MEEGDGDVLDTVLLQKRSNEAATSFTEVVTGEAREQVVLDLELKTAVEPVHRRVAIDIEGASDLVLDEVVLIFEGFFLVSVVGVH